MVLSCLLSTVLSSSRPRTSGSCHWRRGRKHRQELRLQAKVEAAEELRFDVGEYKEMLARLRSISDAWEEGLARVAVRRLREEETAARSGQRKRLRKGMTELETRRRGRGRLCARAARSSKPSRMAWENERVISDEQSVTPSVMDAV